MLVVAAAGSIARLSKLPPVADAMVALTLPASRYTSSVGASNAHRIAAEAPAAIVRVAPLLKVTVTGVCAAWLRLAT